VIAVIFELEPRPGAASRYFELAAALKPELESIDGFISVERFESVARPGRFVSLSFWRDEAAVQRWRGREMHRLAQPEGRSEVLAGYRLRVATVIRDYGLDDREQAPPDSRTAHDPQR
jgi:heme-degrading monooxygenase HmoA